LLAKWVYQLVSIYKRIGVCPSVCPISYWLELSPISLSVWFPIKKMEKSRKKGGEIGSNSGEKLGKN
jgi:hypothetical protein